MKATYRSGLVATLDYGSVEKSIGKEEPIYIYKDIELEENNITMSINEAKWLISELQNLVDALEQNN